jgi:hypothetical protein
MKWSAILVCGIVVLGVCLAVVPVAPLPADAKQAAVSPPKDKPAAAGSEAAPAAADKSKPLAAVAQGKPAPASLKPIRVTAVKNCDQKAKPNTAGLESHILVTVENIAALKESAKEKLVLFLDGMPVKKVYPEAWSIADGTVRFKLTRTADCEATWDKLLGSPDSMTRPVSVSVGPEGGEPVPTLVDGDQKLELVVVRPLGLAFWGIVVIVIIFALFFWLGPKTAILRNFSSTSPYSLALVQMGWWSVLIFIAFIFLWLITGAMPEVSGSSLTLLGIGAGTALGARIIDEGKVTKKLNVLLPQKEKIEQELKRTDLAQDRKTELEQSGKELAAQIAEARSAGSQTTSHGFWNDILNDANGMSLHRFQIVAWTFILGIMFLSKVYHELAMPQLDNGLLALMGISSGTYLGFKFPESVRLSDETPQKKAPA